jgi:hypothetical protein
MSLAFAAGRREPAYLARAFGNAVALVRSAFETG